MTSMEPASPMTLQQRRRCSRGVIEAAAVGFGEIVVRPAGPAELVAARTLFHRGGVGFPPELIGAQPLQAAVVGYLVR